MKVKAGNTWREGLIKAKLANLGWVTPDQTLVKKNGQWTIFNGSEVVRMTHISELLVDTKNWTYHSTRGWYRNVRTTETNFWLPTKFSSGYLAKIRKVSAVFTGYYNNPVDCLGTSMIAVRLSDGTIARMGTRDSWYNSTLGQRIFRGERGFDPDQVTEDLIGERITFVVPEGLTVIGLDLDSMGRVSNDGNTLYPFALRGMKDFEFTLRH